MDIDTGIFFPAVISLKYFHLLALYLCDSMDSKTQWHLFTSFESYSSPISYALLILVVCVCVCVCVFNFQNDHAKAQERYERISIPTVAGWESGVSCLLAELSFLPTVHFHSGYQYSVILEN